MLQKRIYINCIIGLAAVGMLAACIPGGRTVDIDESAVAYLEGLETADVGEAVKKVHEAESSRAQVIEESIAESSRAQAEAIAASQQAEAEAIAASLQAEAESIAAESRAAHEAYLQQLCAGTNLVPGMVRDITDADLPVIHKLFQNLLLVGDSRVEAAMIHGVVTQSEVVYYRGAHCAQMYEKAAQAAYMYPRKVMFFMGLNDTIIYNGDVQAFKAEYRNLIESFRAISPNTHIYVHCLPNVTQASIDRSPATAYCPQFNEAIFQMCMESGYTYVDGTAYLTPDAYYNDGQHFTRRFYMYWVQDIANQLGLWGDLNP